MASNGVEALELVSRKKPDIMLIDVQMPEMDGLTLLSESRSRQDISRLTKMIILSGHDNFEFAQLALEYGVSKYLLKPAGEEDILEAVLEARQPSGGFGAVAAARRRWSKMEGQSSASAKSLFIQWVSGKYAKQDVLNKSNELYIPLQEHDRIAVAVVELDPRPRMRPGFNGEMSSCRSLRCSAWPRSCCPIPLWITSDSGSMLLMVWIVEENQDANEAMPRLNADVSKPLSQTKEVLKLTASAGICASIGAIEDMSLLYAQACRALQDRVVYGHDLAIPYREQPSGISRA